MMKAKVNKVYIHLQLGTVFDAPSEALVHQTDTTLTLEREFGARGGEALINAAAAIGHCEVGGAVVTTAGNLPARMVIHAVGPRWGEGSERGKLASVTFECLRLNEDNGLKSIAMPAISIGTLGYPVENCAVTMLTQIIDYTFEDLLHLRRVILCLDDESIYHIFKLEFERQLQDLRENDEGKVQV